MTRWLGVLALTLGTMLGADNSVGEFLLAAVDFFRGVMLT